MPFRTDIFKRVNQKQISWRMHLENRFKFLFRRKRGWTHSRRHKNLLDNNFKSTGFKEDDYRQSGDIAL